MRMPRVLANCGLAFVLFASFGRADDYVDCSVYDQRVNTIVDYLYEPGDTLYLRGSYEWESDTDADIVMTVTILDEDENVIDTDSLKLTDVTGTGSTTDPDCSGTAPSDDFCWCDVTIDLVRNTVSVESESDSDFFENCHCGP